MRGARLFYLCGFLVAAGLFAGCGASSADIKGTVKYDGKLIEDGHIRFEPVDQKSQPAGATIKAGEYYAPNVSIGLMKVTITGSKVVGQKPLYNTPNSPMQNVTAQYLPDKYADLQASQLTYDAQPGAQTKDWDLSK
jgi:hypothetical protein